MYKEADFVCPECGYESTQIFFAGQEIYAHCDQCRSYNEENIVLMEHIVTRIPQQEAWHTVEDWK